MITDAPLSNRPFRTSMRFAAASGLALLAACVGPATKPAIEQAARDRVTQPPPPSPVAAPAPPPVVAAPVPRVVSADPVLASRITWARLSEADRKLVIEAGAEASGNNRQLMADADTRLLAEFRANPAIAVNQADQAAFRAATASVFERWEARPFGDFVRRLRAAAA